MSAIAYEVLSLYGVVMKRGEPVAIKNAVGMTFGVHCDDLAADEERFVVTNIETGMAAGKGVSREAAIDCARKHIRYAIRRGTLARTFEAGLKRRGETLALAGVEQCATPQAEAMIRFCPECGHLGDITAGYEACCPDWSQARIVPKRFAELCAETFKHCVSKPYGAGAAPADGRAAAAVRTLEAKAYTYTDGAEQWKPPLGPASPCFSTTVEGGQA